MQDLHVSRCRRLYRAGAGSGDEVLPGKIPTRFYVRDEPRVRGVVYLMSTILLPWVAWNSERSTPPFLCAHLLTCKSLEIQQVMADIPDTR